MKPGLLFMFGLYGTTASRESVALLKESGACGVLLLGRNIESPAQVRRLTRELQDKVGRPLLFSVDHEGGWVLRFARGVTPFPGNAALGRSQDPGLAFAVGRHMALELKALGIRLNLAPVLDVVTDRYNPGIGIRSFGRDPVLASRLGAEMIRGMQEHGVSACAKHFPGKGAARQDAHVTMPTIRLPAGEFRRRHLAPFAAAVKAGVDCVMTSHVRFPGLDSSGASATFSRRITKSLLRGSLGFKGAVVCDDLCMGAVTERMPVQQAAVGAVLAGHDILLIAHDVMAQREAAGLIESALEDGAMPRAAFEASGRRIQRLMEKRRGGRLSAPPPSGDSIARLIADKAVESVQEGRVALPLELGADGARSVAFLFPDFREVRERFTFESGPEGPARRLRARLSRWPVPVKVVETPLAQGGAGARAAVRKALQADIIVFFCFEAMRFKGQKAVLDALQRAAPRRAVVCLIRNPWDRGLLKPGVTALDAYGYRDSSLQALLHVLRPG